MELRQSAKYLIEYTLLPSGPPFLSAETGEMQLVAALRMQRVRAQCGRNSYC